MKQCVERGCPWRGEPGHCPWHSNNSRRDDDHAWDENNGYARRRGDGHFSKKSKS